MKRADKFSNNAAKRGRRNNSVIGATLRQSSSATYATSFVPTNRKQRRAKAKLERGVK